MFILGTLRECFYTTLYTSESNTSRNHSKLKKIRRHKSFVNCPQHFSSLSEFTTAYRRKEEGGESVVRLPSLITSSGHLSLLSSLSLSHLFSPPNSFKKVVHSFFPSFSAPRGQLLHRQGGHLGSGVVYYQIHTLLGVPSWVRFCQQEFG